MIEWLTLFFFFFTAMIRICTPPGLPRWLSGKESACQCRETGDKSSIWVGKIPWKGNGNPLQYSYLENPMEEPGRPQSIGSQRVRHNWTHKRTHTVQHSTACKGAYFVLVGQLFIFLLKFSLLCFRWLVTYHPIASVHEHENGVCD